MTYADAAHLQDWDDSRYLDGYGPDDHEEEDDKDGDAEDTAHDEAA